MSHTVRTPLDTSPAASAVPPATIPDAASAVLTMMRHDLRVRAGRGLAFILAGMLLWTGLGIAGVVSVTEQSAALVYLWATGAVFPLALLLGRLMGHQVLTPGNPPAVLGAYLSGLQVLFFPVLLWGYLHQPSVVPWFLGALTGAHFLPFGWLYGSRAYVLGAVLGVAVAAVTGLAFPERTFVFTPFAMAGVFALTALLLAQERRSDRGRNAVLSSPLLT